jgi:hypothetical protein
METEREMSANASNPTYRRNAIVAGILFIACSAASVLSGWPTHSLLSAPDYLTALANHDTRVILGVLLEVVWAVTGAGIAITLYPVLRRRSEGLALGAVVGRVAENIIILVGALSLVVLLTLGQSSVAGSADPASLQASGALLLAVRDWAFGFVGTMMFVVGVTMYYCVMYRWRLVPRWLSGWGLAAAALYLVATIYSALTQEFGFTTANSVLSAPIALQEMVLAVWLIAKGFRSTAPALAPTPAPSSVPVTQS